jgi:hypothetical protein
MRLLVRSWQTSAAAVDDAGSCWITPLIPAGNERGNMGLGHGWSLSLAEYYNSRVIDWLTCDVRDLCAEIDSPVRPVAVNYIIPAPHFPQCRPSSHANNATRGPCKSFFGGQ